MRRADERAWANARRPQPCLLARNLRLQQTVAAELAADWSPQQISGWLAAEYAADAAMRVSPETIYRSLFIQARGVLRKELIGHLRSGRTMRRAKKASAKGQGRGGITDAVSIKERPAEAGRRPGRRSRSGGAAVLTCWQLPGRVCRSRPRYVSLAIAHRSVTPW